MHEGDDERVDKDLGAGTKAFYTIMTEDRISNYQSSLRDGRPIGKQRKSAEQESQR